MYFWKFPEGTVVKFNVYDFKNQAASMDNFDISVCFPASQKKTFTIAFRNQSYSPFLDSRSKDFINQARIIISNYTQSSPLNLQRVSVAYDKTSVYLTATALGQVPPIVNFRLTDYITETQSKVRPAKVDSMMACASICLSSLSCKSFDYCASSDANTLSRCYLIASRDTIGTVVNNASAICVHASRSSNMSRHADTSIRDIYDIITNLVYSNRFKISISSQKGIKKWYTGTDIRADLYKSTNPDDTEGFFLHKFTKLAQRKYLDNVVQAVLMDISIADCAVNCVSQSSICTSFDYTMSTRQCRLSLEVFGSQQTMTDMKTNIYFQTIELTTTTATTPATTTATENNLVCQPEKEKNENGAKAGIAVGCLFLGALVGVLCVLLFIKFRFGSVSRPAKADDATMLSSWDNKHQKFDSN